MAGDDGLDLESLLDGPGFRLFRSLGSHIRNRARLLAGLFIFALVVGYPLAGELISWAVAQPNLLPNDVQVVLLHPLEAVLLRLHVASNLGIFLVVLALLTDAVRLGSRSEVVREAMGEFSMPPLTSGVLRKILGLLAIALGLATLGLLYAWHVLIPFLLTYLQADAASAGLTPTWQLQSWIGFLASLALGSMLSFEVPLVVLLLLRGGIASREMLSSYRKHIWFGSIVIGAFLSPPDPLSLALIAVPMIVLFEVSLIADRVLPHGD